MASLGRLFRLTLGTTLGVWALLLLVTLAAPAQAQQPSSVNPTASSVKEQQLLQELNRIRFAFDANRLWYEHGAWRIAPGYPDPSCTCGTGVCKRARIEELRATHPDTRIAHIGDGRVSDLCAALAADVVFAKHTLAEELADRGVPFEPYSDLRDVVRALGRML